MKYKVILADPAWAFITFSKKRRTPTQKKFRGEATDHYPTMTVEEMKAIPVADWADKNCALIMWVVGSHLKQALDLGEAWGFQYKTDLIWWLKTKMIGADQIDIFTNDVPDPKISMGYYTRKQGEMALLFTRGKPKRLSMSVRQIITEPPREHSRKPDCQYERIEALFAGPYLEMFARQQRAGWDAWGNETDKFKDLT